MLDEAKLERYMQIADDIKKAFAYSKDQDQWYWHDRDEPEALHGPFSTFWACLCDVVEPYEADEE